MPSWVKKRALITVRTYPTSSAKSVEASCTAGVTDKSEWICLFPIPYRLMEEARRFKKWHWIDAGIFKAPNASRPESFKLNPDSIVIRDGVDTRDGWRERRKLMEPLRHSSMCRIQRERDERGVNARLFPAIRD